MTTTKNENCMAFWSGLELTLADEVLQSSPETQQAHKSEVKDLEIDLSRGRPLIDARTLSKRRFGLSISNYALYDLDKFVGVLDRLNEEANTEKKPIHYQIGYLRDLNIGAPQLKYIRVEYDGEVKEQVF
ncbi:MAG: hypothetical protein WCI72_03090 [archaeon]